MPLRRPTCLGLVEICMSLVPLGRLAVPAAAAALGETVGERAAGLVNTMFACRCLEEWLALYRAEISDRHACTQQWGSHFIL